MEIPEWLAREAIPTKPSPVGPEVVASGPTAAWRYEERRRVELLGEQLDVVDGVGEGHDKHAAVIGAEGALCGVPVGARYPAASLRAVTCEKCDDGLQTWRS